MNDAPTPFPAGHRLLGRVQGFLDRLREEGVAVGTAAGVDLGRSLSLLPSLERESFRESCRVTLAKSPSDLKIVDRVFDEYWTYVGGVPVPPRSEEGKVPQARERRRSSQPVPPGRRPPSREETLETIQGRYSATAPSLGHPLFPVSAIEMRRYRAGARRFRRRVATLPGRHWQRAPSGPIDLRRTARRGLRTGGEWVELSHRSRSPRRADLVVLWDVSGSMREHTGPLLALVHALHRVILRTRVFAFGHDIEDVTPLFQGQTYVRAIPELSRRLGRTGGGTQIAHCLAEFRQHWGSVLRPSTTVLIVSDGWDLGESAALAHEMERLRRTSAQVAWVNPYAAEKGFVPATAALQAALPYLDLFASPADFPRPHGSVGPGGTRKLAA